MSHGAATFAAPAPLQDNDGHLLRLQPSDPVPPSRLSMAGGQRMGRPGARASRRVHDQAETGRPEGFRHPDLQHIAADGDAGDVAPDVGHDSPPPELPGPTHRHSARMGRIDEDSAKAAVQEGDAGRSGAVASVGPAIHHRGWTHPEHHDRSEKKRI
jgi:hypothetical protein